MLLPTTYYSCTSHAPTSRNGAPAMTKSSHDQSSWRMKGFLQFAQQHKPSSNITKCCACHEKRSHDQSSWSMKRFLQCAKQHKPSSNVTKCCACHEKRSHDQSSWSMKRFLQCAKQHKSPSNFTKYCACHAKWVSWLILLTYETSFTMRGATGLTLPPHQILPLPRKMTVMMKRHLQCAEQQASPSNLTKYCACHAKWLSWLIVLTYEMVFTMPGANRHHPPHLTKYCSCHAKWLSWLHRAHHMRTSFTMRGATGITLQPHRILRLPRKMTVMIDRAHIWNVIYNARSNRHHRPTSPNTAPATQNDCHDWLCSHMKRQLQCAEQQASPSNLTKYCTCHAKLHSQI